MVRDLTMIFSVLVALVSLGFGVYKNIEAGNAKGFAYEQAYRVLGAVEDANIGPVEKANINDAALGTFGTPPPVIDLSRSSADAPRDPDACSESLMSICISMAGKLADLNILCLKKSDTTDACSQADTEKENISALSCINCFAK